MIEFILASACTGCGRCVEICPTAVFDPSARGVPVIARATDCQTCFMCELHCREDAIFVGPDPEKIEGFDPLAVAPMMALGMLLPAPAVSSATEALASKPTKAQPHTASAVR